MNFKYYKELLNILLDKRGRLSGEKIRLFNNVVTELKSNEYFNSASSMKEISFMIKNEITEIPKCGCNNNLDFNLVKSKYNKFCNTNCDFFKKSKSQKTKETNLQKYGVENVSQFETFKQKKNNSNLEKYGVKSNLSINEVKKKIKNTNLEKYGVEYPQQNKEIRQKTKNTNLQKYGVECTLLNERIKSKTKNTNLEKYGDIVSQRSELVKEKTKKTNLEKYGVISPLSSLKIREKINKTNLEKYGTIKPQIIDEIKLKSLIHQRYNFIKKNLPNRLKNIKDIYNVIPYGWEYSDYISSKSEYQFKHIDCGRIFISNLINGKIPKCYICHKNYGVSIIETKLRDDLIKIFNHQVKTNDRQLIKPYELDIIINDRLAIEVNGRYWHNEENETISLLDKSNLCPIQLIHFWDFELENKYDICKSIILSKLNKYDKIIYGRKCQFKMVESKEANQFFNINHLQGSSNSNYNYGLYYNNELVICIGIGYTRFNNNYNLEIHRIASLLNTKVIGGVSKLFKRIKEDFRGKSIITYADKRYSNGNIYKFLGFTELKDSKPNYLWCKNNQILTRYQTQKHKLSKLLKNFDSNLTEKENMQLNGFYRINDCGNKVFIM